MIYTALYIMFLMRANPLLGQVGGGGALEISTFLGPKWLSPNPFSLALVIDLQASKLLRTRPFKSGPSKANI
jgi:hypothetical protein